MRSELSISDLLAARDREPLAAETAAAIAKDPAAQADLSELQAVRDALCALPPVTPPAELWPAIAAQARTLEAARRPRWARFPLALAASVALLAALTVFWLQPGVLQQAVPLIGDGTAPAGELKVQQDPVAELMERSRRLEAELRRRGTPYGGHGRWNSSQQALAFRIADVDAQLAGGYAPASGPVVAPVAGADRERLWRQRVALLESLLKVPGGQAVAHRAVF